MKTALIGIDMGATHIRVCVMNQSSDVLITEKAKTEALLKGNDINGIVRFCQKVASSYQIIRIVIGLPATISADRKKVLSSPNLSISTQKLEYLSAALSTYFKCEVLLERDVNVQLIYDVNHHQLNNKLVLGVYLGTGLGFAIWQKGQLFIGANGVAGELGHIPYGNEKISCGCGNQGCVETDCSGKVLMQWYHQEKPNYPIESIFTYSQQEIFIQNYLIKLAKAISTAVNLFDPDALILGGGVIDMQDFPFTTLEHLLSKYIRKPLPYETLRLLRAESSSFNGAIGAALYALAREK